MPTCKSDGTHFPGSYAWVFPKGDRLSPGEVRLAQAVVRSRTDSRLLCERLAPAQQVMRILAPRPAPPVRDAVPGIPVRVELRAYVEVDHSHSLIAAIWTVASERIMHRHISRDPPGRVGHACSAVKIFAEVPSRCQRRNKRLEYMIVYGEASHRGRTHHQYSGSGRHIRRRDFRSSQVPASPDLSLRHRSPGKCKS